ncbi:hypothetical protein CBR_g31951 [Chara braunii]|uniref:Uncharacterized protein n=1 Tax=Chara braunii TaxID=69332 RepID=A0A388LG89_CHABU|nr:hypothetical protein CBR_g31951 [Chara braunii]|eukprot:GBG81277.1 hypothetical protein CBR_g31951 [Chara braunii]
MTGLEAGSEFPDSESSLCLISNRGWFQSNAATKNSNPYDVVFEQRPLPGLKTKEAVDAKIPAVLRGMTDMELAASALGGLISYLGMLKVFVAVYVEVYRT